MATSTVARSRQPQPPIGGEDALSLRAAELAAWAKRNVRLIIAVAAVVLVVVTGLVVYRVQQAQTSAEAAERLLALRQNPATATPAGTAELQTFVQRYAGTQEADEARLMLAQARMDAGQPAEAVQALEPLAQSGSPLAAQAAMMMGSAHAEAGDREAAVSAFERAAERADARYQTFEALGQAALMHEEAGDHAAAAAVYERMLAEADEASMQQAVIQMRLTEVRARAGTPGS